MTTMSPDLAHEKDRPGNRAGGLAGNTFAVLFPRWDLLTLGAAVRGRCHSGTGWPPGASL